MLSLNEVVFSTPHITAGWYDVDHTIAVYEFRRNWTWLELFEARATMVANQQHNEAYVYTVAYGNPASPFHFPSWGGLFASLREIMRSEYPQERLNICVYPNNMIRRFFQTTSEFYGLNAQMQKLRFVPTMDAAFALIENDKATIHS
jgi:hypothetical protein